jgi:hypothetical protein
MPGLSPDEWEEIEKLLPSLSSESHRDALAKLLVSVWKRQPAPFAAYSEALAANKIHPSSSTYVTDWTRARDWLHAMARAGLIPADEQPGIDALTDRPAAEDMETAILEMPLPANWRLAKHLKTVRDTLCLLGSDRTFALDTTLSYAQFYPLLVAAKALAGIGSRVSVGSIGVPEGEQRLNEELVKNAMHWLAHLLPGTELKGHRIEKVIAALARKETKPEPEPEPEPEESEQEPTTVLPSSESEPPSMAEAT